MEGNNQYNCPTCNIESNAIRMTFFIDKPYILLIHLNRFEIDMTCNITRKLNNKYVLDVSVK